MSEVDAGPAGQRVLTAGAGPGDHAPVRVLVLDEHQLVTDALRALLDREADLEVVATANSLAAALGADIAPDPDVVVADLVLGGDAAAEMITALQARFPAAGILVVTMVEDLAVIRKIFSAGASGYIDKQAAAVDLVSAVRRLATGEQ